MRTACPGEVSLAGSKCTIALGRGGWSVVIMPQEIMIDNRHGTPHIHPPKKQGDPIRIRSRSFEEVREIVYRHAERNQDVVYRELLEELR